TSTQKSQPPATATDELAPHTPLRRGWYSHYLDPSPDSFAAIITDAQQLSRALGSMGYLEREDAARFLEFIRLSKRLQNIAGLELKQQAISQQDMFLLGSIDKILEKIDVPLPEILRVEASRERGVNFALGRPAQLYCIMQKVEKNWIARGALYSL